MDQLTAVIDSLQNFWMGFLAQVPRVATAIVLFAVGYLVARVARRTLIRLLRRAGVDALAERTGVEDFLLQGGVRYTAVTLTATILYWLILFTITVAVLHAVGLQAAETLFQRVLLYIPNLFVAVLVLIFGSLFAKFVKGATFAYLSNLGVGGADVISAMAQYALLIFVISLVLEQLAIGGAVLVSAFQIAFGAFCLALALAFGLGGREWAAHILGKMWKP